MQEIRRAGGKVMNIADNVAIAIIVTGAMFMASELLPLVLRWKDAGR